MVAAGTLEPVTPMNPAEVDGVFAAAEGQRATPAVAGGIQQRSVDGEDSLLLTDRSTDLLIYGPETRPLLSYWEPPLGRRNERT